MTVTAGKSLAGNCYNQVGHGHSMFLTAAIDYIDVIAVNDVMM